MKGSSVAPAHVPLSSVADVQSIQQIADAVAAAMGVDVTVADASLRRVAGTGPFAGARGEKVPQGCVFERALKGSGTLVVEDPREVALCVDCTGRDQCRETLGMCTPIILDGQAIGILSIVAFTSEQRDRIMASLASFVAFLEKMAELIATKMAEHRLITAIEERSRELEAVMNHIPQGVICVDAQGRIRHINDGAVKLLRLTERRPRRGEDLAGIWPDCMLLRSMARRESHSNVEESYRLPGGGTVRFLSSVSTLLLEDRIIGGVVTFSDLERTHRDVFRVMEKETAFTFDDIIGSSPHMQAAKRQALTAAQYDSNILLTGETGTGKELFARAIHNASPRRDYPFISVNCAAIPEALLESELFGYEPGAFTGASRSGKPGKFELANHGTLFLDEVGDMPLFLQAKLLRVIQTMEITRVGGVHPKRIDARIIAATNQDLAELVRANRFRSDLYYRLNVIPLSLPPLRSRREDVRELSRHFCAYYSRQFNKGPMELTEEALALLESYGWPGNVRELENVIEYAVNFANGPQIRPEDLRARLSVDVRPARTGMDLRSATKEFQRQMVRECVARHGSGPGARERAAEELGISRATLYRILSQD
ncbi:MAG: sigma 54-interacting transcriptional regulator [Firmicutes bacterium]|nr:sigma 54-interacting transcriptional regulator [Bacillota bacterium]